MHYFIQCKVWLQIKGFEGTLEEAIRETERLSNLHRASFELLNCDKTPIGVTHIPKPMYVFEVN